MKKIFNCLGVYVFCVGIHKILNTPWREFSESVERTKRNIERIKKSVDESEDVSDNKSASCKLERIGF